MNVCIPKELMENELYNKLSNGAKMLYGILAGMKKDAERNEWIDERGCRYVLFPKKRMQEELNCSRYSVDLFMKELEVLDLIRLGYCITPIIQRRIYVRNLDDVSAEVLLAHYMANSEVFDKNMNSSEQDPPQAEEKKELAKESEKKKNDTESIDSEEAAPGRNHDPKSDTLSEEETVKEILHLVEDLTGLVFKAFGDDEFEKA